VLGYYVLPRLYVFDAEHLWFNFDPCRMAYFPHAPMLFLHFSGWSLSVFLFCGNWARFWVLF
jgi:hypothetical protein